MLNYTTWFALVCIASKSYEVLVILAWCQDMEHVVHVAGFWHKASALRIKLSACCYQKRGIAGGYLQAEFRGPPCGPRNETKSWPRRF